MLFALALFFGKKNSVDQGAGQIFAKKRNAQAP